MCDHQNIFEWHNKFWNCNQTFKKIMSSLSSLILICMYDYQHSTEHRFVVILIDFYQSIYVFKEKSWVFSYSKEWVDLMSDVNISKTLYSQYTQKYKLPLFKKKVFVLGTSTVSKSCCFILCQYVSWHTVPQRSSWKLLIEL